ncbi:MAG TPA: YidC/Oxa1 family membrane protein insertase [Trueperaceae bacterium]
MNRSIIRWLIAICLPILSVAFGRVSFDVQSLGMDELKGTEGLAALCDGSSAPFWCRLQGSELTLITGKNADYIFDQAGELAALFVKQQTGQDLSGRYDLTSGQNLIPLSAPIPGAALMVNGSYQVPQEVKGSWQRQGDNEFVGSFQYRVDGLAVEKTVTVSYISHTLDLDVQVRRLKGAQEASQIGLAVPGIGKSDDPIIKLGQGDSFTASPPEGPQANPRYLSFQTNKTRGNALILRPAPTAQGQVAGLVRPGVISLVTSLPPEAGAQAAFDVELYGGPNELVRFHQEGYLELPGLFNPNILGRLSLGLLAVLRAIHDVVGSWGLAIIVLTLLFRVLVWPLMSAQTKSMVAMQQLQPKLKALQKKYKDNKEKLQQETMKLYQEHGVNPAGGCLPMLVQMPLLLILWRVFAKFEFSEGFLWLPDLGLPDPFYILPILYVLVMIGNTLLLNRGNTQNIRQQLLINVVFVFFIINLPSGVTLYWVVSMLVQMGQQFLIQRNMPVPAPAT